MSESDAQYRVIQNGNPFADAGTLAGDGSISTVFDIGANVGDVAVHLLANFPEAKVWAFEPHRATFDTLSRRFESEPRLSAVNLGLSNRSGQQTLKLYGTTGLNSILPIDNRAGAFLEGYDTIERGTEIIDMTTLDEYCLDQNIRSIDFLKLDIQGWEQICLQGGDDLLERGAIRFVYTEVVFVDLYENQVFYEDLALYLRKFGYRLFSLYALSFNEAGQLCWADALFCKTH